MVRYGNVSRMLDVVSRNAYAEDAIGIRKLGTATAIGGLQAICETPQSASS